MFFPSSSMTIDNFIGYTSSLSTILMVLIVITTTSLQRKEMENSRMLENQPLPSITPSDKSYIEEIQFFFDVPEQIANLEQRLFFEYKIDNIGNGPAVAIDVVPLIKFWDEKGNVVIKKPVWERIGTLKQNESVEREIMFTNETGKKPSMVECMMKDFLSGGTECGGHLGSATIELLLYYKNVLGASFEQKIGFDLFFYNRDEEIIKACVKLVESARIDYAKDIEKASLLLKNDSEQANELVKKLNDTLSKNEGCTKILFKGNPKYEDFSIRPISENDYQRVMKSRKYGRLIGVEKPEN